MLSISLPEPVIIHRPIDVINALHELSPELDVEVLREAALVGESFRDSCTENDPLSAPGFLAWARTVRALRELLIPRGFKRAFTDPYFPLVLSPDGRTAITVSSGDEGTGAHYRNVKTRYPKGAATSRAIDRNQLQLLDLERDDPGFFLRRDWMTWFFLRRRCRASHKLYLELSLPLSMDADPHVSHWARRIILPAIDFDPQIDSGADTEDEPIEVRVERR